jgi:flavin-dependent dehydrogenase
MTSPIIIAGGGLAGAAAAAGLAQAGCDVTVIEREKGPTDKICGEFLSAEAVDYLRKLGLDVSALGGHPISAISLIRGGMQISAELPFTGLGISRRVLDQALLDHAAHCGAKVLRGQRVTYVSTDHGLSIDVDGIRQIRPETLFLATGKHEVRGQSRETTSRNNLVGFKMHFRLTAKAEELLSGKIALILFPHGYAGVQLFGRRKANLCLLTERSHLKCAGGDWPGLLSNLVCQSSYLRELLAGAEAMLEKPLTIYRVPYGYVHQASCSDPQQIYRLGDQAAVIPSFTGDGMAIALHSAALAVSCLLAGKPAAIYHQRLAADISGQIKRAGQLYLIAQNGFTQPALFGLARLYPASLSLAASLTRVPRRARM